MDSQLRLAAIKAKVRQVTSVASYRPKGMKLASDPDMEPAHRMPYTRALNRSRQKWRSSVYGLDLGMSQTGAEWTPDVKPAVACEVKERRGPHYLDRIAQQLPAKLEKPEKLNNFSM